MADLGQLNIKEASYPLQKYSRGHGDLDWRG